ncbi:membrane protein [Anopheles sinensis]|uniref:Membrane protein n=1 Tax=Anopheles sinensis TaxID=74873 RepID=A0A084WMX9_ANOSI|nr:membrane protein [Anopheles sinensis]
MLLLAATLSVTIASPRRARMAEAEELGDVAGKDVAFVDVQPEGDKVEEVATEVQNDQPAAISEVVSEVASPAQAESVATSENTPGVAAEDTVDAAETGNTATDTVAESTAKLEEENELVKETKPAEESTAKAAVDELVSKIKQIVVTLVETASEFTANWGQNEAANH